MNDRPEGPFYSTRNVRDPVVKDSLNTGQLTGDDAPCSDLCYCERAGLIAEVARMREAKRRAGLIADERSRENVALRVALQKIVNMSDDEDADLDDCIIVATRALALEQSVPTTSQMIHVGMDGQPHSGPRDECPYCHT